MSRCFAVIHVTGPITLIELASFPHLMGEHRFIELQVRNPNDDGSYLWAVRSGDLLAAVTVEVDDDLAVAQLTDTLISIGVPHGPAKVIATSGWERWTSERYREAIAEYSRTATPGSAKA